MNIVHAYVKFIDTVNEVVGKAVMWLFVLLTLSVLTDQFKRYLTGRSTDWAFDINYMIYAVNFMLAGAFCLKHEMHVRVDAIYKAMPPRGRAIMEILFYLILLMPMTLFCLDSTWTNFAQAWQSKEISIVSPWHPPVYHFKFVMPLTFALLFLQEVAQFIRYVHLLVKGVPYDAQ